MTRSINLAAFIDFSAVHDKHTVLQRGYNQNEDLLSLLLISSLNLSLAAVFMSKLPSLTCISFKFDVYVYL